MSTTSLDDIQNSKLDPQLEYRALVRSLKYTQGFGLLFVQCAPVEGESLIARVREEIPEKNIEVLALTTPIENLYDRVDVLFHEKMIDVLFVQGIEHSIYNYEENRLWSDDSQRRSYSETGVPRLLQHLNLSRERFRDSFPLHFIFLVPYFALKYLARRSPDFFDWNSGVLELTVHNYCWHDEQLIEDIRRQARTLKSNVHWEVLEEVMAHIAHQSNKKKASFGRDFILENSRQYEAIITSYEKFSGRKLDKSEAWLKRGIGLSNLKKDEEAIVSYTKAIELKPDDHRILYRIGTTLSKLGCYEEAAFSYRKILECERNNPVIFNNLGAVLFNLGAYKEAVANFDKALRLKPDDAFAWYNRGIVLRKLGRYEEVVVCFDKALEFNPRDHQAWNNRGVALFNLGRYEEAITSYDKALQLKLDKDSAWYNRSTALFNLGRYEDAITSYDKVLQFNPSKHEVFYNKARCCALQTDTEAAIANLSSAIALNPDKYRDRAKTDLDFYSIRQDERFQALVNVN